MGRHSCWTNQKLRKGLWSPEEDEKLLNYITSFGVGSWSSVPKLAGLQRCGKSCRLRWINYLRPDLKRGMFSQQEQDLIISLHKVLGNKWAQISSHLPGRTDNEIKNFWNSTLKKKLMKQGIDPSTHQPLREQVLQNHKSQPNGLLPATMAPVKKELPAFLDTYSPATNNEQVQQHYGLEYVMIKPPFETTSSDFEPRFGPISSQHDYHCVPELIDQSPYLESPRLGEANSYGFDLPCLANLSRNENLQLENEFSDTSNLSVGSFSFYNSSNEAKDSSSSTSNLNMGDINSTPAFSSWEGICETKLEGLCQYDGNQYNKQKINGNSKIFDDIEDQKQEIPLQWGQSLEKDEDQLSCYRLKLMSEELGSVNVDIFQQL